MSWKGWWKRQEGRTEAGLEQEGKPWQPGVSTTKSRISRLGHPPASTSHLLLRPTTRT